MPIGPIDPAGQQPSRAQSAEVSTFSSRRLVHLACLVAIAVTMAMTVSPRAGAAIGSESGVWDYYRAHLSTDSARALSNVEKHHLNEGITRMNSGGHRGALAEFTFILDRFPNHPRALALLSELCDVKWKDLRCESDVIFQRAIAINPRVSQTYVLDGLHHQRRGRRGDAIKAYHRALDINPRSANAHYNLALAYVDEKRFDLANLHGQASYALGFPLPGLKEKLSKAGHWKPLPDEEVKRITELRATTSQDVDKRNESAKDHERPEGDKNPAQRKAAENRDGEKQ